MAATRRSTEARSYRRRPSLPASRTRSAAIHTYRTGQSGWKAAAKVHNVEPSSLRKWVAAYEVHGIDGIRRKCAGGYAAFKLEVLQACVPRRCRAEALSCRQVAALYNIGNVQWKSEHITGEQVQMVRLKLRCRDVWPFFDPPSRCEHYEASY